MSKTEDKQTDQQQSKTKTEDEMEDSFLGDGFSVVDSVNVKAEEEADKKKSTKKEPAVKKEPAKKQDVEKNTEAKKKSSASSTKQSDGDGEKAAAKSEEKAEKKAASESDGVEKKTVEEAKNKAPSPEKKSKPDAEEKSAKVDAEHKEDTLLITTVEEIDGAEGTGNQEGDSKPAEAEGGAKPSVNGVAKKKGKGPPCVWVSNITRHIKATDLKKTFSKHGRVVTAKIVTNGRNFFGYVCLDSQKSAEKCVKVLNNSKIDGRKITVTLERPDQKRTRAVEVKKTVHNDAKDSKKDDDKGDKSKKEETKKDDKDGDSANKSKVPVRKRIEAPPKTKDASIQLKKEMKFLERDNDRLRRRLIEEQKRCRLEMLRVKRMERELRDSEMKLRDERRKFDKERDQLIKKNRLDQMKLDSERVILEKERDDMRRRRDELERELRKMVEAQRVAAAMESRSHRSRKSRTPSPRPSKRFRPDDSKHETGKKSKWPSERTRTPPPPPKLTEPADARGKRDSERFYEERSRREVAVYVPPGEYRDERSSRHRTSFPPEPKSAVVVPPRSSTWSSVQSGQRWSGSAGDVPPTYSERIDGYRAHVPISSSQARESRDVYSHSSDPYRRHSTHYEAVPARKY